MLAYQPSCQPIEGVTIIIPFCKARTLRLGEVKSRVQAVRAGPEGGGLSLEPVYRTVLPVSMVHTESTPPPKMWVSAKDQRLIKGNEIQQYVSPGTYNRADIRSSCSTS